MATPVTHPAAKVRRRGGRAWIEGVPTFKWGHGRDCTFTASLWAALAVSERPYSYEDLMGHSGLAFRVRWHNPRLVPIRDSIHRASLDSID